MANYELSLDRRTHRLVEGDFCDPKPSEAEYILGGASGPFFPECSREERRQLMLLAVLSRLLAEEEVDENCGTSGPSMVTPQVGVPA